MQKQIEMIPIARFNPTIGGKYLVKTSTKHTGLHYFDTNVTISKDGYSIDIHNQNILLISKKPII